MDSAFQPYVDTFTTVTGVTPHIEMQFYELDDNYDGMCDNGVVYISPSHWAKLQEGAREQVIFHELGHCVFHMVHDHAVLYGGVPASIMFPDTFGDDGYYVDHKLYYYQQYLSLIQR